MSSSPLDARDLAHEQDLDTTDDSDADGEHRLRISRVSRLFPVAEALLAAAHSDRPPSNLEHDAIRRVLCQLLGADRLPERLQQRIMAFDPSGLDLESL